MLHDDQRGCNAPDIGLMGGYGAGWSTCSRNDMNKFLQWEWNQILTKFANTNYMRTYEALLLFLIYLWLRAIYCSKWNDKYRISSCSHDGVNNILFLYNRQGNGRCLWKTNIRPEMIRMPNVNLIHQPIGLPLNTSIIEF